MTGEIIDAASKKTLVRFKQERDRLLECLVAATKSFSRERRGKSAVTSLLS